MYTFLLILSSLKSLVSLFQSCKQSLKYLWNWFFMTLIFLLELLLFCRCCYCCCCFFCFFCFFRFSAPSTSSLSMRRFLCLLYHNYHFRFCMDMNDINPFITCYNNCVVALPKTIGLLNLS